MSHLKSLPLGRVSSEHPPPPWASPLIGKARARTVQRANRDAPPTGALPQPFAGNLPQFRRTFLVDAMRGSPAALGLDRFLELFFRQVGDPQRGLALALFVGANSQEIGAIS